MALMSPVESISKNILIFILKISETGNLQKVIFGKMQAFMDLNEISDNGLILTQASLMELYRGLNVEIAVDEYNAVFGTPLFELSYVPLTENGFEGRRRIVFNVKKCNLHKLENSVELDARTIDQRLLEKFGLNVLPALFQNDGPFYEPKVIYRNIPIDYGALFGFQMSGIKTENGETTYHEISWERKDDESVLFDHIRESDPTFQLVPSDHESLTKIYNSKLQRTLKGVILIESIRLMENMTGFYKSPFDFSGAHNMARELGHISEVDTKNYLRSNTWLDEINDTMGGWAYSCFQNQKQELEKFQDWQKHSLEKMEQKLKLHETRLWRDADAESSHVEHLQNALNCYKLYAEFNRDCSEKLFAKLRDMAKDCGQLHEKIIDRYFFLL